MERGARVLQEQILPLVNAISQALGAATQHTDRKKENKGKTGGQ